MMDSSLFALSADVTESDLVNDSQRFDDSDGFIGATDCLKSSNGFDISNPQESSKFEPSSAPDASQSFGSGSPSPSTGADQTSSSLLVWIIAICACLVVGVIVTVGLFLRHRKGRAEDMSGAGTPDDSLLTDVNENGKADEVGENDMTTL
jgi:preprotein translocase subunit SecG